MVKVPGSCGELAQGMLENNNILITCPISWYSKVEIEFCRPNVAEEKKNCKSYQAVELLLRRHKMQREFSLHINSQLPRGKGMASSSADIAASLVAAAKALSLELFADDIKEIALSIEPTDGIFLSGITAFDHISGSICDNLGVPPLMKIAIFDFGGEVDTLAFNKRQDLHELRRKKKDQFTEAYNLVKEGIFRSNPVLIAKGATISALANQIILNKPSLEKIILIGNSCGALGVNVAHSGTVAGVLFDSNIMEAFDSCVAKIVSDCGTLQYLGSADLISGGIFEEGKS